MECGRFSGRGCGSRGSRSHDQSRVSTSNFDQLDTNGDGEGDACDDDDDGDTILDGSDNCPIDPNPTQSDAEQVIYVVLMYALQKNVKMIL